MSRSVFILGAGASRAAGGPLMADFLDSAEELLKSGRAGPASTSFGLVFKGITALQAVHSKSNLDLDNIESVFAAFEIAGLLDKLGNLDPQEVQKLGSAIRRLIVRTLDMRIMYPVSNGHVRPLVPYEAFATLVRDMFLRDRMGVSIITFNYDVAADYAFKWLELTIDYCLDSNINQNGLQFMKLHGSLNWAHCSECNLIIPWCLLEVFDASSLPEYICLGEISPTLAGFSHCGKRSSPEPIIVPPTWNKTRYYEELGTIWRRAGQHLSEAENIFVIGYSLPETDLFFRYLYALGTVGDTRLKRFWVFDPNPSDQFRARYESLLGQMARSRFQIQQKTFGEALPTIRSELGFD